MKYKYGGKVKISNKWFEILTSGMINLDGMHFGVENLECIIQEYKPPTEFITEEEWLLYSIPQTDGTRKPPRREDINELLRRKFSHFCNLKVYTKGMDEPKDISGCANLMLVSNPSYWISTSYSFLKDGDKYILQSDLPKFTN